VNSAINEWHKNKGKYTLRYTEEKCFPVNGNNEITFKYSVE
jgi:hypothetical protein